MEPYRQGRHITGTVDGMETTKWFRWVVVVIVCAWRPHSAAANTLVVLQSSVVLHRSRFFPPLFLSFSLSLSLSLSLPLSLSLSTIDIGAFSSGVPGRRSTTLGWDAEQDGRGRSETEKGVRPG